VQLHVPVVLVKLISSPCIKICTLVDNVCLGCSRTGEEIREWLRATDERKLQILERIANERISN